MLFCLESRTWDSQEVLGHLGVTEEEVGVPYTGRVVHAKVHLTKKL